MQGQLSAVLRDQLLAELASIGGSDQAGEWAHKRIAAKNTERVRCRPAWLGSADPDPIAGLRGVDKSALPIGAPRRLRDKSHLAFVASEPCLLCARRPCDPHHVRFAQGGALGRKVSDEFTVPLCRSHHRALHRSGSEYLWWENVGIDPLMVARRLWKRTLLERGSLVARRKPRGSDAPANDTPELPRQGA